MESEHPPLMLCEFLTSKTGEEAGQPFPSKANRCSATGGLDRLPLEQQSELCLGPAHQHCPLRLKAMAKTFAPPLGAAEALPSYEQEPFTAEETGGGKKRRSAPEDLENLPIGEMFEPQPVDFDTDEEVPEEEEPKPKGGKEQRSQPFRREMEDWISGLFKDKRGQ